MDDQKSRSRHEQFTWTAQGRVDEDSPLRFFVFSDMVMMLFGRLDANRCRNRQKEEDMRDRMEIDAEVVESSAGGGGDN